MVITLISEQEIFIKRQLETGQYNNPNDVISDAFNLLVNQQKRAKYFITGGKLAEEKLKEKIIIAKKLIKESKNKPIDIEKKKLAKELKELLDHTQNLANSQNITEEEISAEINTYRRGE